MESNLAKQEIKDSLKLCNFFMNLIGFTLHKPTSLSDIVIQRLIFVWTIVGVSIHVFSETSFLYVTSRNSPRIEDVVPLIHTVGYGSLSKRHACVNV